MEDYIILRSGYNQAINECTESIDKLNIDEEYKNLVKSEILRTQRRYLIGKNKYEGFLYKYYDKENQLGYIILDDIYCLKGGVIDIKNNTSTTIDEKECMFIKSQFEIAWQKQFDNENEIHSEFNKVLVR